ncbi:MAG: hypothetical protein NT011_10625 [Kiritimatiellaeota bacterium]|nr:hypothetical protein [Kiritimatiellota bacterium]
MKKRAQLVCQHLENISREALERDPEIIYQYVRGRQGVYALFAGHHNSPGFQGFVLA